MLYKKEASFFRMLLAAVLVNVVLQMGLDTVWLVMMTGKGFLALLPIRAIKCILMIPIQMVGIKAMQVFLRTSPIA
ncbi:MAG: folate transporter, partial [Pygmaiobacter sp.]